MWIAWVYGHLYVEPMRLTMRAHGYDLCVGCGYDLRGLGPDVGCCPECGHERDVLPDDPADESETTGSS